MDIITIARKLEPLLPREVERWLRARELADPVMKDMIDKHIISVAHKRLGNFERKILLSLPPEKRANGPLRLGKVIYDTEKWPFGISGNELCQHLGIFGRSGAGKTNVAFNLLEELAGRGIPVIFFDWKRTGRHLIPRLGKKVRVYTPGRSICPFPFNPFLAPPGLERHVYIQHLVDVLSAAYTLGDGASSLIQRATTKLYVDGITNPTINDILTALKNDESKGRAIGWKTSAVRALESISYASLSSHDQQAQEQVANKLLRSFTILELDALSDSSKKFLIPLLCLWIFNSKLVEKEREKLNLVLLLEEAHHVLHRREGGPTIMEQLLRQCRELGVGVVVVDQHPSLISQAALGNTYTTICLNLKDPSDINKAAALSLVDEKEKHIFSMLPVGHGIVKMQDRWRRPFLVRFPEVPVDKGAITDDELLTLSKRRLGSEAGVSDTLAPLRPEEGAGHALARLRLPDEGFSDDVLRFIRDVLDNRDDGVDARYKRLRFSAEKGNRIKAGLIRAGIVDSQSIQVDRTRKVLLRVTEGVRKVLGLEGISFTRESIAHEYWKRFYAQRFRDEGYSVTVEAPRKRGTVDILATRRSKSNPRRSESVAIEIETGMSDVVWNVKQDLLSGFQTILVIAVAGSLPKLEAHLQKAQLLGIRRVRLLRDENQIFK